MQTFYNGIGGIGTNATQSSDSGTTGNIYGGGTTGSVQYINTGVTLDVKPRVNPGGLVYLEIQQEVSNPSGPAGPSGNQPIAQRQIQTQVAVQSGETLMLGGLIQDNRIDGNTGLPLVSRVPVLRNLFGTTKQQKSRTELIVLITPRVISSVDEGRQATEDYSRQFESLAPLQAKAQTVNPQTPAPAPAQPARTYPIPEPVKPQEELPRDH